MYDMESNTLARIETPRNVTSPLPVEILQQIFILSVHDYYYEHQVGDTSTVPCWVNISYVCRRWRNVALECPTIWTYIFIASQRWTEELFHRSKQASLKICFLPSRRPSKWLNNLEKLLNHIERIQELRLGLPSSQIKYIFSKLSFHAPRLQSLSIIVDQAFHPPPFFDFQPDMPALRMLGLSWCPVQLHSFKLDSLTSLCLQHVPYLFRKDVEHFLGILRCMQNLQSLYVWCTFPRVISIPSTVFVASEKICLPYLSRLFIEGRFPTISGFLSPVNIPLKANVCLELDCITLYSGDNYDLFYALLAQRCGMAEDPAVLGPIFRSLVLDIDSSKDIKLTCSTYEHDFTALSVDAWESNFPFQIRFYPAGLWRYVHDIVVNVSRSLPLSNVQSFYIAEPPFSSEFWRNMMGRLPDVRYIKPSRGYMPDFSVLSPTALIPGEDMQNQGTLASSAAQVLAPLLEGLELERIRFSESGSDPQESVITRQSLFDALSKRPGSRGRLTMTRCKIGVRSVDLVMEWNDGDVHIVSETACPWIDSEEVDDRQEEVNGQEDDNAEEKDSGDSEYSGDD